MSLPLMILCMVSLLIVLVVAIIAAANGAIGEGALVAIVAIVGIVILAVSLANTDVSPDRAEALSSGARESINYWFPKPTFWGNVMHLIIGLVGDIILAFILLATVGPQPFVELVIFAAPITFHLAAGFNAVNTMDQAYQFGAAFWAALIIGGGIALLSNAVVAGVVGSA